MRTIEEAFTFDDVLLVPQYSDLSTRYEADTKTRVGNMILEIPIFSANMDTITGLEMGLAMSSAGGMGVLHRYASPDTIQSWLVQARNQNRTVIPSVGVKSEDWVAAEMYRLAADTICLDIAHGDSKAAVDMVRYLKGLGFCVIAGNVCTGSGALRLADAGADVIKVGVGPGSVCTTRTVTGHGYPQLSAIMNVAKVLNHNANVEIIADGGLHNSGDIVKALAAGAHAIMTGFLLSGTNETPLIEGRSIYRGMASSSAQMDYKNLVGNGAPEGVEVYAAPKGPVAGVLKSLAAGIRSGMSYSGVRDLQSLREEARFVRVTANTVTENKTRVP